MDENVPKCQSLGRLIQAVYIRFCNRAIRLFDSPIFLMSSLFECYFQVRMIAIYMNKSDLKVTIWLV